MDANPIRRAIAICGKTQAGLAEMSGLSQQYISLLLSGKKSPSVEAAIAISQATGGVVRIEDLAPEVVQAVAQELARRSEVAGPAEEPAPSEAA